MERGDAKKFVCNWSCLLLRQLLWDETIVVNARTEREARACHLRNPPHFPHPFVVARRHATAHIIQNRGAHLRRRIDRIRVRKRPQHRIPFHAVVSRYCAPRGPRVKGRCSAARSYQSVPDLSLPRGFVRSMNCRLAFEKGWLPGVILSEELSADASSAFELIAEMLFAIGASGRAGGDFSTFTAGVEASEEATAGVIRSLEALEEFGKAVTQQARAIAAKTMKAPLRSQNKMMAGAAATVTTLLYFGTGVTGPLVTFFAGTFPARRSPPGPGTLVLTRYSSHYWFPELLL
jgi:hypothetical protein